MAISQRTATSGTAASSAGFTPTFPAGTTVGDLVFVVVANANTTGPATPSGWTSVFSGSAGTLQHLSIFSAPYSDALTRAFTNAASLAAWACQSLFLPGFTLSVDGSAAGSNNTTSNTTLPTGAPTTGSAAGDYELLAYAWTSSGTISAVASGSTIDKTQANSTTISVAIGHNNTTSLPASTVDTAFSQTLSASNARKTGVGVNVTSTLVAVDAGVVLNSALTQSGTVPIITNGDRNADHTGQWPADAVTSFDQAKAGPRYIIKVGPTDYRCWYEGISNATDGSSQSLTQVCYATSTNGTDWVKYSSNPVLVPSPTGTAPTWEHNEFSIDCVVWDPDAGLFKLWGHGGNNSGPRQIGYATSPDGITWTKYASNPIIANGGSGSWNEKILADATVIRLSPTDYRMWVRGWNAALVSSIGYFTSTDGIAWTAYASNPICPSNFIAGQNLNSPRVLLINGVFHMWLGTDANGLYYSSSRDGINWSTPTSVYTGTVNAVTGGDTTHAYVDGTSVRIQFGRDESITPARRAIWEATLNGGTPTTATPNPTTGGGIWSNGTVGVAAWASLADGAVALSGQIITDRYNGHAASITVTAETGGTAPAANRHWEVWLESATDGGASGSPTLSSAGGIFLGVLPAPAAINTAATVEFDTAGVLAILPETWCVKLVNRTGQTMNASGHSCLVQMRRAG